MTNPQRRRLRWPQEAEWARVESIRLLESNEGLWERHEECLRLAEAEALAPAPNTYRVLFHLSEARGIARLIDRNGVMIRLRLTEAGFGKERSEGL